MVGGVIPKPEGSVDFFNLYCQEVGNINGRPCRFGIVQIWKRECS